MVKHQLINVHPRKYSTRQGNHRSDPSTQATPAPKYECQNARTHAIENPGPICRTNNATASSRAPWCRNGRMMYIGSAKHANENNGTKKKSPGQHISGC